ncbi:Uncharacterized protein HZ326_16481 [Fusarium oxysporum f. sp. albedinis]|nr:Uncharacterized protein HZ326_16481 [Fusarium oxysporum f. sp. albedinis]
MPPTFSQKRRRTAGDDSRQPTIRFAQIASHIHQHQLPIPIAIVTIQLAAMARFQDHLSSAFRRNSQKSSAITVESISQSSHIALSSDSEQGLQLCESGSLTIATDSDGLDGSRSAACDWICLINGHGEQLYTSMQFVINAVESGVGAVSAFAPRLGLSSFLNGIGGTRRGPVSCGNWDGTRPILEGRVPVRLLTAPSYCA